VRVARLRERNPTASRLPAPGAEQDGLCRGARWRPNSAVYGGCQEFFRVAASKPTLESIPNLLKGALMLTDTPLADGVIANLDNDPRIPESLEIAVAADDGVVTLRGTVESFSQRRAAGQDAKKVDGVYDIDNQLKVSLTGANRRDDDEIRGAALQNLVWDVEVPSEFVDVKVEDGWVTLKGDVSYQFESDAAYDDVASLYGVLGVTNEIVVSNP
jgi:osmotically-inducible protein OsmY